MCGIVGITANESVSSNIIGALKKLEYRGYDSAGIAINTESQIHQKKAKGKLDNLILSLQKDGFDGKVGIGHTRWATHGEPSERNAHPHSSRKVSLVHNGIIENASELKSRTELKNYNFESDTDSEVITALITHYLNEGHDHMESVKQTISLLEGSYALAIIFSDLKDKIIGARNGSPLVAGTDGNSSSLGSDSIALSSIAKKVCYLEDGDIVVLSRENVEIYNSSGDKANREFVDIGIMDTEVSKGSYNHFMEKEIHEHPKAVGETFRQFIDHDQGIISVDDIGLNFNDISKVHLIACGTAYYACLVAKYYFEQYARLPVECDMASEFRYRDPVLDNKALYIFVSQSGETADTKAALDYCKDAKVRTLSIVNVMNSSIARESDYCLYTKAGAEIGVASTKAFTAQLSVLLSMALHCGTKNNNVTIEQNREICKEIMQAPQILEKAIKRSYELKETAKAIIDSKGVMYLGRGTAFPLALEGALKFKEISYIHAEGYPAGEMKHGPLALIEKDLPVVCIVPPGPLFHKTVSNIQEVIARGGRILMITDDNSLESSSENIWKIFRLPKTPKSIEAIVYSVPIHMLAYYTAVELGNDVDQPRNLAKSVTVE